MYLKNQLADVGTQFKQCAVNNKQTLNRAEADLIISFPSSQYPKKRAILYDD